MKIQSECLTGDIIARYLQRHLSQAEAEQVEEHVGQCSPCAEALNNASKTISFFEALASCSQYAEELAASAAPLAALKSTLKALRLGSTESPAAKSLASGNNDPYRTMSSADLSAPPPSAGELGWLGPYRLVEKIGHGGMGFVFRAEDPDLDRDVAIKVMQPEIAADPNARSRFLGEARKAAKVTHDNIVPIYHVSKDGDTPYFVMPLLRGQPLDKRLRQGSPLTLQETIRIGREVAIGLAAAHACGLIHRDIKPANLWLEDGPKATVKILDFGLARQEEIPSGVGEPLTRPGTVMGTPEYMSPEQARGETVDFSTDLYSLGVVLYQMVAGRLPFIATTASGYLVAHATATPEDVRKLNPAIPPLLADTIMKLLEKEPAWRLESAQALVETLERLLATNGSPPRPKPSWRRLLIAAGVLLALTLGVAAVLILFPPWKAAEPGLAKSPLFEGSLEVRVTEKGDKLRQRLFLHQPHALPLKAGMQMEFEATVDRPAYLYVVYLDSNGEATPLFPWKAYDWKQRPTEERRVRLYQKGPLGESPSGMESLLLLVREELLPDDVDVAALFTGLPKQKGLSDPRAWAWFEDGKSVPGDGVRGPARVWQGNGEDDPVLRTQAMLRDKLRPLFPYTRAVCFAFQGD